MKKYIATWYNQIETVKVDEEPIEASSHEEAVAKAWTRYNGNPPAPLLSLVEIIT